MEEKPLISKKSVRFDATVEVYVIDRVDREQKAELFYSRDEIHFFQWRSQSTKVLARHLKRANDLREKLNGRKLYIDKLKRQTAERKRLFEQQLQGNVG